MYFSLREKYLRFSGNIGRPYKFAIEKENEAPAKSLHFIFTFKNLRNICFLTLHLKLFNICQTFEALWYFFDLVQIFGDLWYFLTSFKLLEHNGICFDLVQTFGALWYFFYLVQTFGSLWYFFTWFKSTSIPSMSFPCSPIFRR